LKGIDHQNFDQHREFLLGCLDQFTQQQIAKCFNSAPIDQAIPDNSIKKIFAFAPNCARATNKTMSDLGAESK